ncbi:MFS transporter [Novosphingobium sp. Chol11]|uniref:MFS transporter n=1 Tax=Novosphingobium sp. Chol11 TaxID=1385763 RepID=UPI000BE4019C|nr:MFS transporter [Novosphingobium sp. Chol11]
MSGRLASRPAMCVSSGGEDRDTARGFLGWRMVAIAAVTQNVAVGLTFGSFGTLVLAIEERFATTRTLSALGISLVILIYSLSAPLISPLIARTSIRRVLTTGALLGASGYCLLPLAGSIGQFLGIFALLISPGFLLLGVIPSNILASNWFVRQQGRALGFVTMPVFVMLVPMISAWGLHHYGLTAVLVGVGLAHLLVLPLMPFVIDRPEQIGQQPLGHADGIARAEIHQLLPWRTLLARPALWLVTLAVGIVVGGGVLKAAHMVPLIMGQGWSLEEASFLFALSGGTGILGAMAFGWLADRFGPGRALAANSVVQGLVWFIFLQPAPYWLLVLDAVVVGACGGGIAAAQGVLLTRLFGPRNFAQVMGMVTMFTVPFTFGAAPLASALFDATHSYWTPIALQIAGFALAAVIFLILQARGAAQLPNMER